MQLANYSVHNRISRFYWFAVDSVSNGTNSMSNGTNNNGTNHISKEEDSKLS